MGFWRRRRRLPPAVLLPSLDRLAGLIQRVVELLDQTSPPPASRPAEEELVVKPHELELAPTADGWVAFVHSAEGYRLHELEGAPPARHATFELEERRFRVLRLGPSPLPGDRRRCVYLEKEPPSEERTFDR